MTDYDHDGDTPRDFCGCSCHRYFDPDGLLCLDGYCDGCGDRAGSGNRADPAPPGWDCGCEPPCHTVADHDQETAA